MCRVFGVSFGGEGGRSAALVLGECRAEGARRIFEPQGERALSCGLPPSSRERLRGFGSGSHLDPVGPCGAPSCKDPGELRRESGVHLLVCLFVCLRT